MDTNRMKKTAQWFYDTVFRDEAVKPRTCAPAEKLPSLLRAARSLEEIPGRWQSRESIFLKQGKLLASYEDDYEYKKSVVRYYPTYQSLTDQELRGYFSWRTKLRKGDVQKTSLSFAFLYIYELINQIGIENPLEGYRKLKDFRDAYVPLDDSIAPYLARWMTDYVVYYGLDANLLADAPQVVFDRSLSVLDLIQEQEEAKVMYAIKQLAPKWLSRSKFYGAHQADCDAVIVRILRKVSDHYAKRTKKTMVEQFFGELSQCQVWLFDTAVFCNPFPKRSTEFVVDERCVYRCRNGHWTVTKHTNIPASDRKLDNLLKTIDAVMREEYAYKHPVKYGIETKWTIKLIREEVRAFLAERKAVEARKITIDYAQLAKIRREAAMTQERLTVEEELEAETIEPVQTAAPDPISEAPEVDGPLSKPEYRLLQCLLYGRSLDWIQKEGYMLSVLSDSINDKLYDVFMDSVLDDTPEPLEDYIEDLKEMIKP